MDLSDIDKFRDPIWRVSNLYSIRERSGKVIPFRPRPQQLHVLTMIFSHGFKRIIILKARQIGFSTRAFVQAQLPSLEPVRLHPSERVSAVREARV
jgi:hypothetical protein